MKIKDVCYRITQQKNRRIIGEMNYKMAEIKEKGNASDNSGQNKKRAEASSEASISLSQNENGSPRL